MLFDVKAKRKFEEGKKKYVYVTLSRARGSMENDIGKEVESDLELTRAWAEWYIDEVNKGRREIKIKNVPVPGIFSVERVLLLSDERSSVMADSQTKAPSTPVEHVEHSWIQTSTDPVKWGKTFYHRFKCENCGVTSRRYLETVQEGEEVKPTDKWADDYQLEWEYYGTKGFLYCDTAIALFKARAARAAKKAESDKKPEATKPEAPKTTPTEEGTTKPVAPKPTKPEAPKPPTPTEMKRPSPPKPPSPPKAQTESRPSKQRSKRTK